MCKTDAIMVAPNQPLRLLFLTRLVVLNNWNLHDLNPKVEGKCEALLTVLIWKLKRLTSSLDSALQ